MATIIDFATGRIRTGATASAGSDTTKKEPPRRKKNSLAAERRRMELAKIHVAKKQLCLDDETYRMLLREQFGVESAGELDDRQRRDCILYMQRCGFTGTRGVATRRHGAADRRSDVPRILTQDDDGLGRDVYMRKIEAMLAEKGRVEGSVVPWGYAVGILKRQSGGVTRCFEHATVEQLRAVIAALVYDARRKGRYAGTWSEAQGDRHE